MLRIQKILPSLYLKWKNSPFKNIIIAGFEALIR